MREEIDKFKSRKEWKKCFYLKKQAEMKGKNSAGIANDGPEILGILTHYRNMLEKQRKKDLSQLKN